MTRRQIGLIVALVGLLGGPLPAYQAGRAVYAHFATADELQGLRKCVDLRLAELEIEAKRAKVRRLEWEERRLRRELAAETSASAKRILQRDIDAIEKDVARLLREIGE